MDFIEKLKEAYYLCTGKKSSIDSILCGDYKLQVKFMTEHIGLEAPKKEGDVGYDMVVGEDTIVHSRGELPTNVRTFTKIKIPSGLAGYIKPRSSANKRGLRVQEGTIDNGYTGELFVFVYNDTKEDILLKKGDKISQIIFSPCICPPILHVEALPETERGETGFGSTNK